MTAEFAAPALAGAVTAAAERLAAAGIEAARREAMLLMAHLLKSDIGIIYRENERRLSVDEHAAFDALVARRAAREPLSHITGRREFWSLEFRVSGDVLDPRPDSETLIEAVLDYCAAGFAPRHILDLGTGSGCLLLALLHELPEAEGTGVDLSEAALIVARENAERLSLARRATFIRSHWGEALAGTFDLIVSNPPYIPAAEIASLQPEVRDYEPHLALIGGADGLDCYRAIIADARRLLRPDGIIIFEAGAGQAPDVGRLLTEAGLRDVRFFRDIAGIERCIAAIDRK